MDLVKTLLVYMTVLLTSSTAFTPALTPMPAGYSTPSPTAVTTQAPVYTPFPVATQPVVTATPALTTLSVGDRGDNVRVMQTRLRELGYLTGTVDGIFGRETLRAVERFQTYNKLSVDGIAGAKTLNKLYYDRNVVYAPVDVTPPPTARPAATANVPVYYITNTGVRLYTEVVTLPEGRTTLRANNARVPQGYVLTGMSQYTITVSGNGTPSPASATFIYARQVTAPPVTAQVTVNYLDENNQRLNQEVLTLPQGTITVTANDRMVPSGYTLLSVRSTTVNVSANGTASPSAVSFVYKKAAVSVMVPVNYVDTNGTTLASDQINLSVGSHPVIANSGYVPQGYTLQGADTVTVTVDAAGNATPPSVTFTYKAPASADVPVYYRDSLGKSLYEEVQRLAQGANTVSANQALVPAGYVLQGSSSVTVTVDANGAASPTEVVFVYLAPATDTPAPATDTPAPATDTPAPATDTPAPATDTPAPPTTPGTEVGFLPEYQVVRFKDGTYPVYTGPGENYFRVGNAAVGGGDCRLYGYTGDWLLIGYGTSDGGYRIGYITTAALPEGITTSELVLAGAQRVLATAAKINDDPIINPVAFGELPAGSTVTLLAYFKDNERYVYVEVANLQDGQPARGFIRADRLQ